MGKKVASRNNSVTFRFEKRGSPKKRWQKSRSEDAVEESSSLLLLLLLDVETFWVVGAVAAILRFFLVLRIICFLLIGDESFATDLTDHGLIETKTGQKLPSRCRQGGGRTSQGHTRADLPRELRIVRMVQYY